MRAILDKGRSPGEFLPDVPDVPVRFDKGPGKMDSTPDFRPQEPQGKAMAPYQSQPDAPDKPGSPPDRKLLFLPRAREGNFFLPVVVFQAPDRPARHHRSRYAGRGCFGLPFAVSILNVRWESNRNLRVRRAFRREG